MSQLPSVKRQRIDDGKVRLVDDCPGNWKFLVSLDCSSIREQLDSIIKDLQSSFDWISSLEIFPDLHISLTRPLLVRQSSLESLRSRLVDQLGSPEMMQRFPLDLQITNLCVLHNESGVRQFFCLGLESHSQLDSLVDLVDQAHQLAPYFDDRSMHISWSSCKLPSKLPFQIVLPGAEEDEQQVETSIPRFDSRTVLHTFPHPIPLRLSYHHLQVTLGQNKTSILDL